MLRTDRKLDGHTCSVVAPGELQIADGAHLQAGDRHHVAAGEPPYIVEEDLYSAWRLEQVAVPVDDQAQSTDKKKAAEEKNTGGEIAPAGRAGCCC